MAQILDRDTQTVLVKITMNEYKKLEDMDFFASEDTKNTTRKYSRAFINDLKEAEEEYSDGKFSGPFSTKEEIHTYLNSLV